MRDGLAKWKEMPKERRLRAQAPRREEVQRGEDRYPKDGLVLRQYSRDFEPGGGRAKRKLGDMENPWNTDTVWFRADEMRQLLPRDLSKGARQAWPDALARRLAQLHLIDNVVGQAIPFRNIETASIATEVAGAEKDGIALRFSGETRAAENGRRMALRLLGRATWDAKKQRFTAFELVAVGTRSAAALRNAPDGDTQDYPVGFVFRLASEALADRVAPANFGAYPWSR
jgi:hypothetical protein